MTITSAIRKVETARDKAGLTNDFHIYEKRECPKNGNKKDLSQFKLKEYFSISSLIELLQKVQRGEMKKDNEFLTMFSNMTKMIRIIEHKDTNVFWVVEK